MMKTMLGRRDAACANTFSMPDANAPDVNAIVPKAALRSSVRRVIFCMRGMVFILFARLGPKTGPVFASSVTHVGAPQIVARAILQPRNKLASVCCKLRLAVAFGTVLPTVLPNSSRVAAPNLVPASASRSRRSSAPVSPLQHRPQPDFQVLLFLSFDVPPIYAILFLRPALTPFILSLWSSFSAPFVGKRVSGMGYEQMCGASERTHVPVALRHS